MNLLYSLPHKIQTLFVLQKLGCILISLIVWFVLTDTVLLVVTETVEVVVVSDVVEKLRRVDVKA